MSWFERDSYWAINPTNEWFVFPRGPYTPSVDNSSSNVDIIRQAIARSRIDTDDKEQYVANQGVINSNGTADAMVIGGRFAVSDHEYMSRFYQKPPPSVKRIEGKNDNEDDMEQKHEEDVVYRKQIRSIQQQRLDKAKREEDEDHFVRTWGPDRNRDPPPLRQLVDDTSNWRKRREIQYTLQGFAKHAIYEIVQATAYMKRLQDAIDTLDGLIQAADEDTEDADILNEMRQKRNDKLVITTRYVKSVNMDNTIINEMIDDMRTIANESDFVTARDKTGNIFAIAQMFPDVLYSRGFSATRVVRVARSHTGRPDDILQTLFDRIMEWAEWKRKLMVVIPSHIRRVFPRVSYPGLEIIAETSDLKCEVDYKDDPLGYPEFNTDNTISKECSICGIDMFTRGGTSESHFRCRTCLFNRHNFYVCYQCHQEQMHLIQPEDEIHNVQTHYLIPYKLVPVLLSDIKVFERGSVVYRMLDRANTTERYINTDLQRFRRTDQGADILRVYESDDALGFSPEERLEDPVDGITIFQILQRLCVLPSLKHMRNEIMDIIDDIRNGFTHPMNLRMNVLGMYIIISEVTHEANKWACTCLLLVSFPNSHSESLLVHHHIRKISQYVYIRNGGTFRVYFSPQHIQVFESIPTAAFNEQEQKQSSPWLFVDVLTGTDEEGNPLIEDYEYSVANPRDIADEIQQATSIDDSYVPYRSNNRKRSDSGEDDQDKRQRTESTEEQIGGKNGNDGDHKDQNNAKKPKRDIIVISDSESSESEEDAQDVFDRTSAEELGVDVKTFRGWRESNAAAAGDVSSTDYDEGDDDEDEEEDGFSKFRVEPGSDSGNESLTEVKAQPGTTIEKLIDGRDLDLSDQEMAGSLALSVIEHKQWAYDDVKTQVALLSDKYPDYRFESSMVQAAIDRLIKVRDSKRTNLIDQMEAKYKAEEQELQELLQSGMTEEEAFDVMESKHTNQSEQEEKQIEELMSRGMTEEEAYDAMDNSDEDIVPKKADISPEAKEREWHKAIMAQDAILRREENRLKSLMKKESKSTKRQAKKETKDLDKQRQKEKKERERQQLLDMIEAEKQKIKIQKLKEQGASLHPRNGIDPFDS